MSQSVEEQVVSYVRQAVKAGSEGEPLPPVPAGLTLALAQLTGKEIASRVLPAVGSQLHKNARAVGQTPASAAVRGTGNSR